MTWIYAFKDVNGDRLLSINEKEREIRVNVNKKTAFEEFDRDGNRVVEGAELDPILFSTGHTPRDSTFTAAQLGLQSIKVDKEYDGVGNPRANSSYRNKITFANGGQGGFLDHRAMFKLPSGVNLPSNPSQPPSATQPVTPPPVVNTTPPASNQTPVNDNVLGRNSERTNLVNNLGQMLGSVRALIMLIIRLLGSPFLA